MASFHHFEVEQAIIFRAEIPIHQKPKVVSHDGVCSQWRIRGLKLKPPFEIKIKDGCVASSHYSVHRTLSYPYQEDYKHLFLSL